jgi:hypothetical protein
MSGGASVDVRNCTTCGQERASVTKQEYGQTRVYYQCLVCTPSWSPRRATDISTFSSAPSHPVRP